MLEAAHPVLCTRGSCWVSAPCRVQQGGAPWGFRHGSTHLIICGTVTLEFSSKAFIMSPLQRMLSTHCKRHRWEVGDGSREDGPTAHQTGT